MKPGYKQTEVGVIPEDWTVSSVGQEFNIKLGKMLDVEKNVGVPKPFLGNSAVQWGHIDVRDLGEIRLSPTDLQRFRLKDGDLLVCEGGDVGRTAIWRDQLDECYYQKALHRLRPKRGYSIELMRNLLERMSASGFLQNYVTQTSIAHLPKDKFETVPIPVPSTKAEQNAIAEALSDADALIESLAQLLTKKRDLKQGAMQELLTGKRRLPGFATDWAAMKFGDIAAPKKDRIDPKKSGAERFCVELEHIASATGVLLGSAVTTIESSLKSTFNPGDVLFGKLRAYLRKYWIADCPGVCSTEIWVLVPKGILRSAEFLFQLVQTDAFIETASSSYGTHMPRSDWSVVKNHEVSLPTDDQEQAAIAAIFSGMDAEIANLEARLTKARELKQGMMQELLTGRIRLMPRSSNVVSLPVKQVEAKSSGGEHNSQINEAVVLSILTHRFGSEQFPLGRFRRTKLTYLLHRHVEHEAQGFLKKAAGPYNPQIKYGGAEKIAIKNGYVRQHKSGQFEGFVAADNIDKAHAYFDKWYGADVLKWLDKFKFKKKDELELLTTVDMAMHDLTKQGQEVNLESVKMVIKDHPEWTPKLDRAVFSDDNIVRAMAECRTLFVD